MLFHFESRAFQHVMYKWQVHSAIGRGRPLQTDFGRLADGIAVSLRQFHISSTRAEGEGQRGKLRQSIQASARCKSVG